MGAFLADAGAAILFHGVSVEARAALVTTLAKQQATDTSVLLVHSPRRAQELAAEVETYAEWLQPKTSLQVLHFPEQPPVGIDASRRADRICERLAVLSRLLCQAQQARLIIATPEALLGACPQRHSFERRQLKLCCGATQPFTALIHTLIHEFDYAAEALCEYPGQVATRGGLIDLYPYDAKQPYRIDFFGDEIESIRSFDPGSQRTLSEVDHITLSAGSNRYEADAADGQLMDYLSERSIAWIFEEPSQLVHEHPYRFEPTSAVCAQIQNFAQVAALRAGANDRCWGICSIDTDPALFDQARRVERATEPTVNYRLHPSRVQVGMDRFESDQSARSQFESRIADWAQKEQRTVYFVSQSEREAKRIAQQLAQNPRTATLKPKYLYGTIAGGFLCHGRTAWLPLKQSKQSGGIVLITDNEYFGRQRRTIKRSSEHARPTVSQVDKRLDFTELVDGDPLVHLQHGICLFRGLRTLEIQGGAKEVISVEFADQMTVHVPLHESQLLTRYVGLSKSSPKLAKIGAVSWGKTRAAAELATLDYAAELLNLHAKRSGHGGYAFPSDHPWQAMFEDTFPFTETPDQLRAIEATKADMESALPMDRLICGDVGFGKTEVAIRAAFKAVLAGKQVALLVPTTVLCQQHLNMFRERMAEYPIFIDMVSRFRSSAQNKANIAALAAGQLDIVIGTHRLLSRDVHFNDLGLLIVDEEQRFGVRQKERIKQLRANVDILTLSATPIPRTLYLALAGARAMSVIETPPVNRHPIQTIVNSYDPTLIKRAIQAETDRGGQVFYLHNRVSTIQRVATQIRAMHPKLRVAVGHGQMENNALETIMTQFVAGEFDVLVCTTIIESGIDIPNCNTLIIEGADRFGLSQLYQIRGRVGRFQRQAYAYLLLHRHATLVDQAQKRLNALKQHTQLGAGFRIAMRDLELRGAGNLLGSQQSGHIAGVGFELYCQLLKQSVARLKGEPGAEHIRAEVKLDFISSGAGGSRSRRTSGSFAFAALKEAEYNTHSDQLVEAALPTDYISEPRLRVDFYRRLALAQNEATITAIAEELADRFGTLPRATQALIEVSQVRVCAEAAGVRRVESERDRLICHLATPTQNREFLKTGARFPRLSAQDPLKRLREIRQFLQRPQP